MHISSVTIYNFRSLEHQTIELSPNVNFLVGQNGQGKTNFIEAISYLSRAKSFRTSQAKDLVQAGKKEASVFANLIQEGHQFNLGISIGDKSKEYFLNHEKVASLKEFLGHLLCVSFTPSDLMLIKGGPVERRSYLDKHIIDINPSYMEAYLSYQRALRNKNIILKKGVSDENDLIPWNNILAQEAVKILQGRNDFIKSITGKVNYFYNCFSKDNSEIKLHLKNNFSLKEEDISIQAIQDVYARNIKREIALQSATIGPQRDDLEIFLNNENSRVFSSQGEARSLVLSLKLSAIELIEERREIIPIVLLDDVDSELDSSRRDALLELLFAKERQTVVTGTQIRTFDLEKFSNYCVFDVQGGKIQKREN